VTDATFTPGANSAPVPPMREPLLPALKTLATRLAPPLLLAAAV
jgi:hypothetical protein